MQILLVRVGADQTPAGGGFNAPVDVSTSAFVYVGIPESKPVLRGWETSYRSRRLARQLARMGTSLPAALLRLNMHLDPDFERCTYGDHGWRAAQLARLDRGDIVVFYAGLRADGCDRLVYALVDQLTVACHLPAGKIRGRSLNAHARRKAVEPDELVVIGTRRRSGRYDRCLPIGEFRDNAYRIRRDLLITWGGISVRDGFLQRSAVFPHARDPGKFLDWLAWQHARIVKRNH